MSVDLWESREAEDRRKEAERVRRRKMIEKLFGSVRSFILGAVTVGAVASAFGAIGSYQVLQEQREAQEREIARDAKELANKAGQDDINRRMLRQLEMQSADLDDAEKHIAFLERNAKK